MNIVTGIDPNAINQADRKLNCVGCHTPIQRTGQSPADVGAEHLSFVWAPIFSDLLLHQMPIINAERISQRPRDPLVIARRFTNGARRGEDATKDEGKRRPFDTFDLPRNLADDTFSNQKASADGGEFRATSLMGLGRIGPPFLHDARVYLSDLTVDGKPAGTVTTNRKLTNAPLVVRSVDDALLAAIEPTTCLPPMTRTRPGRRVLGVPCRRWPPTCPTAPSPKDVICPPYDSATSQTDRSDSREVIRRFRALSPDDQQAVIEFLKQL